MSNLSIAVVCGGPSAEADVSRSSGACVAEGLRSTYSNVATLELDAAIAETLRAGEFDVVFPVLHGPPGEDGSFQGLLEILDIPYVGSGVLASACAMNKVVAKRAFRAFGLPVAREAIVTRAEPIADAVARVIREIGSDVVVKPIGQGSAVGVLFATDAASIEEAIRHAWSYDDLVLVEERIVGREVTCAILERDGIESLPVVEVRTPGDTWYDFEHRYTVGLSEHLIPAPLDPVQYRRVEEIARGAHIALGCRDLSRADFVVPAAGDPILLEVNTLPGMTPTSLYPDAARAAGISFDELVAILVQRAASRAGVAAQ
jgi:D-alanine-D-alanine ligase